MTNSLFHTDHAPTWADPIAMLYACHEKVKRFCKQLDRLPEYLAQHSCNEATQHAIAQICRYFNQAAPLHHADEEEDFFPMLVHYCPETQATIEQLSHQHIDLHQYWQEIHAQLQAILAGQRNAPDAQAIHAFTNAYAKHIPIEEQLFALGEQHIPPTQLHEIGKKMEQRRHD